VLSARRVEGQSRSGTRTKKLLPAHAREGADCSGAEHLKGRESGKASWEKSLLLRAEKKVPDSVRKGEKSAPKGRR